MKRYIFILLFVLTPIIITAAQKKNPEWITVPSIVYPTEVYLNGTGYGNTRDEAELEAVKNLSSIFGQTVIAENTVSKKMQNAISDGEISFSTTNNLEQNIKNQIEAKNLIGIEIAEYYYHQTEKKWYAIAILNKAKTADIYEGLILKNDETVRKALKEAENELESFYGYSEICFALEIAVENDKLLKNLSVINVDRGEQLSKKVVSLESIKVLQKKSAEKITIYIDIKNDADKKIKSAFQSVFSKYGFKTSSSKKERYGLEGKYTSEITNKGKVNYCIYTLNLEFNDFSENESLFAINLDGREGAPSVNNAINRSYRVLEKNIYSEFSEKFDSFINNLTFK